MAPGPLRLHEAFDELSSCRSRRAVCFNLTQAYAQTADSAATHPAFWGSPSVDGGKCCANLGEVRSHIDALDHEIIRLMAERGKYVAEAGRFKANPAAVSAPARVEEIIVKVRKSRGRTACPKASRKAPIAQ